MPAGSIVEVDFFVHLKECALLNDLSGKKIPSGKCILSKVSC